MLRGTWCVPAVLETALRQAGRAVPEPVSGLLLIDTGASHTCIGTEVAQALHLRPTSLGGTYGAGGRHENPEYLARIEFRIPVEGGRKGTVSMETVALSVPDLNRQFESASPSWNFPKTVTWRLVGLIGRDLLQSMVFVFDGPAAKFSLTGLR